MGALAGSLGRLRRVMAVPARGAEDEARIARNLRVSLRVAVCGTVAAALANLASGRLPGALAIGVLCLLIVAAQWLLRRGRLQAAAVLSLASIVAAIHALQLLGYGVHDRAALMYPVVILLAAIFLDLRLLVATTALCTLSVGVVLRFEEIGVLQTPYSGKLGWLPMVDLTIIFVATAVTVHLLVADVQRAIAAMRARDVSLAAVNRELEARSAEMERFTYVVSHDLKSPLVTIRGFLGYVEQEARAGDLERMTADMNRIRKATDRMGRLLDDLLELSRTGRIDRPHEDLPLIEVVREARGLVEGRLAARGVRVEIEGPLPGVHGDPQRLVEVLQNLLDNAAKFMGEQREPRVWIGSRIEADGRVLVFVRDNGVGIEPAHHERVFELFHRLDPQEEGTGLGLALARRIVAAHGGRLWVESQGSGSGSTFYLTLPAATS